LNNANFQGSVEGVEVLVHLSLKHA